MNNTWIAALVFPLIFFAEGCATMTSKKMSDTHSGRDHSAISLEPEVVVLDNGMRVLLVVDHSAPVVALQNWVKFGGADEEEKFAGVAHVFEHMLFKGSEKFPQGEMAGAIESAGGQVNAWTSNDETVYHLTVSSRFWQQGFDALADAMLNPLFDAEELRKEKEVVQEEIRRGKDSPDREMWHRLADLVYTRHPYGRPVIGFPETVDKIDRDALVRIFDQWYVPNNMVLVAVGDFDREELLQKVHQTYVKKASKKLPVRPRDREPDQLELRIDSFDFRAELARVALGFPVVSAQHVDVAALDVLSDLLGSGFNSRLYQVLKREQNLVQDVSAYSYNPVDTGMFMINASFAPEHAADVVRELSAQAKAAHDILVSNDELEAAKARIIAQFVHAQETYQGIARFVGRFDTSYDDPAFSQRYIAAIEALSADDLRRVASHYLQPDRMNVVLMVPEGTDVPDHTIITGWVEDGLNRRQALPAERLGEDSEVGVTWFALPGDIRVVVQHVETAPIVAINTAFAAGIWAQPEQQSGVARLAAALWDQGTHLRSASEIERITDKIGGSVGASAGQDVFNVSSRFLRNELDTGMELYFDVLFNPVFPENELKIEQQDQIQAIRSLRENKFRFTIKAFNEHFYKGHPYSRHAFGEVESVQGLTRKDLRVFRDRVLASPAVISIVGNISPQEVLERLQVLLPAGFDAREVQTYTVAPVQHPGKSLQQVDLKDDGNQTHIMWGFPTVDRLHPDRVPLRALDAILSGMSGRLFSELRDQKSLAYMVTAFDSYPNATGFFAFYIACAPDKEQESIAEFERVMQEIRENGVTEAELERAKRYLQGSTDIQLQATASRASLHASSLLLRDRWDAHREFTEALETVTVEDVKRVAQKYFEEGRSVRVVLRAGE